MQPYDRMYAFVGARYKHVRIHEDTVLPIYPLGPQAHNLQAVHTGGKH